MGGSHGGRVTCCTRRTRCRCATGFTPTASNWGGLKPNSSIAVDKQGTINLIDASKSSGVGHFVLVSSLLTNGADCKQTDNANYKVLQAFGGVLASKREAEVYLQKSGTPTSARFCPAPLWRRLFLRRSVGTHRSRFYGSSPGWLEQRASHRRHCGARSGHALRNRWRSRARNQSRPGMAHAHPALILHDPGHHTQWLSDGKRSHRTVVI